MEEFSKDPDDNITDVYKLQDKYGSIYSVSSTVEGYDGSYSYESSTWEDATNDLSLEIYNFIKKVL